MGFKLCLNAKIINGTCPLPCLISRGHTGYKRPILTQNRWGVPHKTRFHPPTAAPCPANHFAPLAQEQVVQTGVPSKGGDNFSQGPSMAKTAPTWEKKHSKTHRNS